MNAPTEEWYCIRKSVHSGLGYGMTGSSPFLQDQHLRLNEAEYNPFDHRWRLHPWTQKELNQGYWNNKLEGSYYEDNNDNDNNISSTSINTSPTQNKEN